MIYTLVDVFIVVFEFYFKFFFVGGGGRCFNVRELSDSPGLN